MIQKFNPRKIKQLNKINFLLKLFFHEKKSNSMLDIHRAKQILIIDPTLIGDIVMLIPFLRVIRKNAPEAEITLVCGKWAEPILKEQNLVEKFIFIDNKILNSPTKMIKQWGTVRNALSEVNQKYYDIALEPRGDLRYIFFMHYCNAGRKVSYNYTGGESLLTDIVNGADEVEHLVDDKLYFAKAIGCDVLEEDRYPILYLTEKQIAENKNFIRENKLFGKKVVGIHPGTSLKIKQWDGYSDLIVKLNENIENVVFIIFEGPGEEEAVNRVLNSANEHNIKVIVSKTGISEYMQRLAMCNVVICNDSGAGHIAAAYGVEVFVIFGPILPKLARPYAKSNVHVFSDDDMSCKPCLSTICEDNGNKCIKNITVDMVYEEVFENLCGGSK